MMSQAYGQTENVKAQKFSDSLLLKLRENASPLDMYTTHQSLENAEFGYIPVLGVGGEMRDAGGRLQDIQYDDTAMYQRRYNYDRFSKATVLDQRDFDKLTFDPTSDLVAQHAEAYNRKKNRVFFNRFFSSYWQKELDQQEVMKDFPTSNILAANSNLYNSSGTAATGLTISKLKTLRELFNDNYLCGDTVDNTKTGAVIALTTKDINVLTEDIRVASKDYQMQSVYASDGTLKGFLGFRFLEMSQELIGSFTQSVGGDTVLTARLPVWFPQGIRRIQDKMTTTMDKLVGKEGQPMQVYTQAQLDFVRTDERMVYAIDVKRV